MSSFLDSQNSISFTTLSYGFLGMVLTAIIACSFRMKCREINMGCCKITRDVDAENVELEIENAHRDRIPPPSNV
jgi:hypothetical protein